MPRRCTIVALLMLGIILKVQAQEEKVVFSASGGFYEQGFSLSLDCLYPDHHIRYTTNGVTPTAESTRYNDPLYLDERLFSTSDIYTIPIATEDQMYYPDQMEKCIVIRAAVFDAYGQRISPTATNTYFIASLGNQSHGLPLVSICADSLDLFDYERGILVPGIHFDPDNPKWSGNYFQSGRDWERTANIEFYELDNTGINQLAGLRTHGYVGRSYQQKNLAVFARDDYGKKRFKHRFFESLDIDSFKHLQLKPFRSAWTAAGVQDALCQAIASQSVHVESLATRPVVLYLNGEYWGIYFVHEKPDERYLESHFGIDIDDCDIMKNWSWEADHGHCEDLIAFLKTLENADLSDSMEYHRLQDLIDLESFIDYQILELFLVNTDWPANNTRFWRTEHGKWRCIFHDADACLVSTVFDVFANATYHGNNTYPASSISTVLLRRLLANPTFRERFFNRFQELLYTRFQPSETIPLLHLLEQKLQDEIPLQAYRFGNPMDYYEWAQQCNHIKEFLLRQPEVLSKQLDGFIENEPWNYGEWLCYPNPFSESLSLSFHTDCTESTFLNLFDLSGRCVYSSPFEIHSGPNAMTLHPELSSGVYVLTLGKIRQKLIKQ